MLTNNGDKIKATPTPTEILYALAYKVITTKMIVKTKQDDLARPSMFLPTWSKTGRNELCRYQRVRKSCLRPDLPGHQLFSICFMYIWCVSFTQLLIHTLNSLVQDTVGSFTCSCVPGYVYLLHHHYTECAFHWLSSSSGIAWKSRPHAQQSTFHQRCQWEFFHFIAFSITTIIIIGEEIMPKS